MRPVMAATQGVGDCSSTGPLQDGQPDKSATSAADINQNTLSELRRLQLAVCRLAPQSSLVAALQAGLDGDLWAGDGELRSTPGPRRRPTPGDTSAAVDTIRRSSPAFSLLLDECHHSPSSGPGQTGVGLSGPATPAVTGLLELSDSESLLEVAQSVTARLASGRELDNSSEEDMVMSPAASVGPAPAKHVDGQLALSVGAAAADWTVSPAAAAAATVTVSEGCPVSSACEWRQSRSPPAELSSRDAPVNDGLAADGEEKRMETAYGRTSALLNGSPGPPPETSKILRENATAEGVGPLISPLNSPELVLSAAEGEGCRSGEVTPVCGQRRDTGQTTDEDDEVLDLSLCSSIDRLSLLELHTPGKQIQCKDDESQEGASNATYLENNSRTAAGISGNVIQALHSKDGAAFADLCYKLPGEVDVEPLSQLSSEESPPEDGEILSSDTDQVSSEGAFLQHDVKRVVGKAKLNSSEASGSPALRSAERLSRSCCRDTDGGRRDCTATAQTGPSPAIAAQFGDDGRAAAPRRAFRPSRRKVTVPRSRPVQSPVDSGGAAAEAAAVGQSAGIVSTIAERLLLRKSSLRVRSSPTRKKRLAQELDSASPAVKQCRVMVATLTPDSAKKLCRRHELRIGRSVKRCFKLNKLFSQAKEGIMGMLASKSCQPAATCEESGQQVMAPEEKMIGRIGKTDGSGKKTKTPEKKTNMFEEKTKAPENTMVVEKKVKVYQDETKLSQDRVTMSEEKMRSNEKTELPRTKAAIRGEESKASEEETKTSVEKTAALEEKTNVFEGKTKVSQEKTIVSKNNVTVSKEKTEACVQRTNLFQEEGNVCQEKTTASEQKAAVFGGKMKTLKDETNVLEVKKGVSQERTKVLHEKLRTSIENVNVPKMKLNVSDGKTLPGMGDVIVLEGSGDPKQKPSNNISGEKSARGTKQRGRISELDFPVLSVAARSNRMSSHPLSQTDELLQSVPSQARHPLSVPSRQDSGTASSEPLLKRSADSRSISASASGSATAVRSSCSAVNIPLADNRRTGDRQAITDGRSTDMEPTRKVRRKIEAPSPDIATKSRWEQPPEPESGSGSVSKLLKLADQCKGKTSSGRNSLRSLQISLPACAGENRQVALTVGRDVRSASISRELSELYDGELTDSSTPDAVSADEGDKQSNMAAILKRLTARTLRGDFKIPKRRLTEKSAQSERPALDNFTVTAPVAPQPSGGGGGGGSAAPAGHGTAVARIPDVSRLRLPPPSPPAPSTSSWVAPPVGSGVYVTNTRYPSATTTSATRLATNTPVPCLKPPSAVDQPDHWPEKTRGDPGRRALAPNIRTTESRTDIAGSFVCHVMPSSTQSDHSRDRNPAPTIPLGHHPRPPSASHKPSTVTAPAEPMVQCTTFTRPESTAPSTSSRSSGEPDEITVLDDDEDVPAEPQPARCRGAEQTALIPAHVGPPPPAERAPAYEFREFISEDPAENADNNAVEWEVMRRLNSDSERYRFVRQRWRNTEIPNPHHCLTFYGYRRRLVRANLERLGLPVRRQPELDAARRGRGMKRTLSAASFDSGQPTGKRPRLAAGCAFVADWLLEQGRTLRTAGRLLPSLEVARRRMDQEAVRFCRQLAFNLQLTPAQRSRELSHLQERQLHELQREFGPRTRRAAHRMAAAKAETETFFRFYTGLNNTDAADASWLTEQQRQEVQDFENYIVDLDRVYGRCLDEDL